MTERIERPKTSRKAVAKETFRSRVHALYADVRSWLARDERFSFEQSASSVTDAIGHYEVDRLQVYAAGARIADFKPVAATVLLGAGRIDVWGPIDFAWVYYYESSPTLTSKVTHRNGTTDRTTVHLFNGIDRPGWYWKDVYRGDVFPIDRRRLFELFEEISDFGSQHA